MRPTKRRDGPSKRTARRKGIGPKVEKAKPSPSEQARILLELAGSTDHGVLLDSLGIGASGKPSLRELVKQGTVKVSLEEGRAFLIEGPENFGKVFLICDRAGRSYQLLETDYARSNIDEPLLLEATKAGVYDSIFYLLGLLTSNVEEAMEDPVLSQLSASVDQSEEVSKQVGRVSESLSKSGFQEMFSLSLSGKPKGDMREERLDLIADMAERDVNMFFSSNPPIPDLPPLFITALFPQDERDRLLRILKSSPSALRALVLSRGARSSSLALPALQQTLPLLARLFEIFASTDPSLCTERSRREWREELAALVDGPMKGARPTPMLIALEARAHLDGLTWERLR